MEYKKQVQDNRDKENEFLSNYKREQVVSQDFINYASAEINNMYAYKLYIVFYFNKCKTLPKGYLDDAVITENPLSSNAFFALMQKLIYCSPDTDIERIYNTILHSVHPKFHSFLLSELITWFAEKGDRSYQESFLKVMTQIEKTSTDSTLLATVQEYKPYYLMSGTMLPDSVLDKTYLRSFQSKQKITLRQLFNSYNNTAVYLDFWGSWCKACRQTNRESVANKPYFAEKNIAIVYVAWDNENAWLQAVNEDSITQNQYLLLLGDENNLRDTPMDNFLKINSFPRYILFNKSHEIEILSAPKPIGCLFDELKEIIERNPERFVSEIRK